MRTIHPSPRLVQGIFVLLAGAMVLLGSVNSARAQSQKMKKMIMQLQEMNQADGYLDAHRGVKQPLELLGGPISFTVQQNSGGVHVSLPDNRVLDEDVFGTPKMPLAFTGTPGITGVPVPLRGTKNGHFTQFKKKSPFGNKSLVLPHGRLTFKGTDATATDAATTEDKVKFKASWKDKKGNTYSVRCCKMLAKEGVEYPTFGGVVTNHLMHGWSGVGTPLMPTMYTYAAFWGMGSVLKNGKVLDKPRIVHGMLTEYVRKEGYNLAKDSEITPTRRQFHLMVAPFMPVKGKDKFRQKKVHTGFSLPNGMELPFWHVMFGNLDIESRRGQ